MSLKIAILIDAENISYKDLPEILDQSYRLGEIMLAAVYGDWEKPNLQQWLELASENGFKIRHQTSAANTKNSSDMKMIMDAMDVLHYTAADVFCLVTNDADYVPLCDKIREANKTVVGIGYLHAADAFVRACDQYIFVSRDTVQTPVAVPVPQMETVTDVPLPQSEQSEALDQKAIRKLLRKALAQAPQDAHGWVLMSQLGSAIRNFDADFQSNTYGHATLTKFLESMPEFVEVQGQNGTSAARLKTVQPPLPANPPKIRKLLTKAFAECEPDKQGWVKLSPLGKALKEVTPDFRTNTYGHANLTKLLTSLPDFVELQGKNGNKAARLKSSNDIDQPQSKKLEKILINAFSESDKDSQGWVLLSTLGTSVKKVKKGFNHKGYGHSTLKKLLQSMPHFVELKTKGSVNFVRLKK